MGTFRLTRKKKKDECDNMMCDRKADYLISCTMKNRRVFANVKTKVCKRCKKIHTAHGTVKIIKRLGDNK